MRRARAAVLLLALAGASGCGDESTVPVPPPVVEHPVATTDDADVVARVGGMAITAAELDEPLSLSLHDLDRARWTLRAMRLREMLVARVLGEHAAAEGLSVDAYLARHAGDDPARRAAFVDEQLAAAGVSVLLPEPEPPFVAVDADDDPVRGAPDAPVTIVEFLDFQSPHCRTMQPTLRRVLDAYPRHVRLVVRDFPQAVHRDAAVAAEAAGCAAEQGGYWQYHDALLQAQDDLGRAALRRHAARVGLDADRLEACLDAGTMRDEVARDAATARALGLTVTPTLFVNGRYMKGPQSEEQLRARVDAELRRVGTDPVQARAAAASTTTTRAAPLAVSSTMLTAATSTTLPAPPPADADPNRPTTPSATITLPAARVQEALRDRRRLVRDLRPRTGPGLEGRRLVTVRQAAPDSLYAAMGLEPGDLLGAVDGQLLLDDGAALLDALRRGGTVRLRIIRRGLVHDFEYRIE